MFNEFNSYGATTPSYLNAPQVSKDLLKRAPNLKASLAKTVKDKLPAADIVGLQRKKPSALQWYYSGWKAKILIPTAIALHALRSRKEPGKVKYLKSVGAGAVYMPYLAYVIGMGAYAAYKEFSK